MKFKIGDRIKNINTGDFSVVSGVENLQNFNSKAWRWEDITVYAARQEKDGKPFRFNEDYEIHWERAE